MKTISKPVRATEEVFKKLKILSAEEGRTIGKMLEILLKNYSDKESENNERL